MYRVIKATRDFPEYTTYAGVPDKDIMMKEMWGTWQSYCEEGLQSLVDSGEIDTMTFDEVVDFLSKKYRIKRVYVEEMTDDLIGMMGIDMKSTYHNSWQKWRDPNYHPERQ